MQNIQNKNLAYCKEWIPNDNDILTVQACFDDLVVWLDNYPSPSFVDV